VSAINAALSRVLPPNAYGAIFATKFAEVNVLVLAIAIDFAAPIGIVRENLTLETIALVNVLSTVATLSDVVYPVIVPNCPAASPVNIEILPPLYASGAAEKNLSKPT
jgi:hypothetical protein